MLAESFNQHRLQNVGCCMVQGRRLTASGVDLKLDAITFFDGAIDNFTNMDSYIWQRFAGIDYLQFTGFVAQIADITDLATRFSIEWGLVGNDFDGFAS